jgi:CO/xanthine dehydrogenase Mo-binding subunit
MDELAHQMRMDPLELRVRNYAERDFYHHADWSSKHLDECYRLGAERFGWPGHYVEPRSMPDGHELVGFGVATTAYPAVAWPARARVEAFDDGEIRAVVYGCGRPIAIEITRGQLCAGDTAYDSNGLRQFLLERGMQPVIPG